jgi:cellulose synthase/poly-beta-1,6-N-acetylglucosamine synthase-like glycosyltransferase
MSLTEDFEIQVEATLEGRRILWNHHTRVYDEKPTSLIASIRQKIRWGQGHWYVALHNTGKTFRALCDGRISFWEFLSLMTYMYSIAAYVVAGVQLAVSTALCLLVPGRPFFDFSLSSILAGGLIFGYSYLFLFYIADWMDNRIRFSFRTIPVMIGGFFANLIVGFFNEIVGLLRCGDQQHWVKTEHAIDAETRRDEQTPQLQHRAA